MLLASWWFWTLLFIWAARHSASLAVTCIGLRVLDLRGNVWTLVRSGFLDEGERMRGDTGARDHDLSHSWRCQSS